MKVLISIATYGTKNLKYLNQVIDEYRSYKKYDIDIIIHGTVPIDRNDVKFITHSNPKNTVYFHRNDFVDNQNNYDLFIFTEDDILIKEETIDIYLKYNNLLPINYCLGFLRFENTIERIKYLIDLWINVPGHNFIKDFELNINNQSYFSVTNVHQSCYVLTKEKLQFIINERKYAISDLQYTSNILESASSSIFSDWTPSGVFNKVIPISIQDISKCFIEHLPGNHCNPPGINAETSAEQFKQYAVTVNHLLTTLNFK